MGLMQSAIAGGPVAVQAIERFKPGTTFEDGHQCVYDIPGPDNSRRCQCGAIRSFTLVGRTAR